ncbi:MAG: aspartyl protease family protein [Myxococcales bacterium]
MRTLAIAVAALLPLAPVRGQQTYKWIDSDGNIHVTSTPPPDDSPSRLPEPAPPPASSPSPPPARTERPRLRRFEIPYVSREGHAQRVIVPVTLNGRVTVPMALDTGSPGLIIWSALAEKLELLSRDEGALEVTAAGIGGKAPAILGIVDSVDIGGASQRYVPVTVSAPLSDKFDGLVGMDFMSQYTMSVLSAKRRVVLQERDLGPDAPGGHPESWWRDNFAKFRALRDAWKAYLAVVEEKLADGGANHDLVLRQKAIALRQVREAEKLYDRLDRFASREAVPRHWR